MTPQELIKKAEEARLAAEAERLAQLEKERKTRLTLAGSCAGVLVVLLLILLILRKKRK